MPISLRGHISRLSGDQRGSIAIIFAIALVGVVAISGVSLDYARSVSVQNKLQRDLDAALLSSWQAEQAGIPVEEMVKKHFIANWKSTEGITTPVLDIREQADGSVKGTATAAVDASLSRVLGFDSVSIKVESEIGVANQHMEIALVVDNTASMTGDKLAALRKSAGELVTNAFKSKNAKDYVKIGVVPFAQYVNVGTANRNKPWMSVPNDTSTQVTSCSMQKPIIGKSNCRMETYTYMNDGTPVTYQSEVCDYQYGPESEVCSTWTDAKTWNGCVGSRSYPLNTLDEQYSTPIPGIQNVSCNSPVLPLTNEEATIRASLDAMTAVGETYVPAGLIWGWRVLSQDAPFEEGTAYGAMKDGQPVKKILILMTDGANTISATQPTHGGNDATAANQLTTEICTNVKAKKIEIYTIAFSVTDDTIKNVLKGCASPGHYYFDAADTQELQTAFQNISKNLRALALAK